MNLVIQLLPFVLIALICLVGGVCYVGQASTWRRGVRRETQTQEPRKMRPASQVETRGNRPAKTLTKVPAPRGSVLRLRDLDMTPQQIAAALERPLQEVEIILKFEEVKRRRLATS